MTPTLDLEALQKLRDLEAHGSPGVVAKITGAFLDDAPRKIEAMRTGLAGTDFEAIADAAHTLRGGCGYLGASRLSELCAQLEQGDGGGAKDQIAAIEAELAAYEDALNKELAQNT